MEKTGKEEKRYGLVGKDISYSFSKTYFAEKFEKLQLSNHSYANYDLKEISQFKIMLKEGEISGLNVTIPYKEAVIPFLKNLEETAKKIGAVNTIKFTTQGLIGYNTDAYGFQKSLESHLKKTHKNALILGTGGASKAIAYVFKTLKISYKFVSRTPQNGQLSYEEISKDLIKKHQIIINCSPVGTYPNNTDKPKIPYNYLTKNHLLFDLIYNPEKTAFLKEGEKKGAAIQNGLKMLEFQAEKSWEIWNS